MVGTKPADDDGYFEEMTKAIFRSGFNGKVIESKWDGFRKAFADFSVRKVARFGERDLDRLLKDKAIVRNYRKIEAAMNNAREIVALQGEHESFEKYLRSVSREGEEKLCKAISSRFSHLGTWTSLFFLRSVGLEMPEMTEKWERERAGKIKKVS
jgi:DNA-3-methyladenine glycosylase I